jgi:hypothetical protein
MLVERQELLARGGIPHLATPIIGASDELITRFVECTIGQREQMRSKYLVQLKFLLLVLHLLLNKFYSGSDK